MATVIAAAHRATASARCRATSSITLDGYGSGSRRARLAAGSSSARARAAATHNERRPYMASLRARPLPPRSTARALVGATHRDGRRRPRSPDDEASSRRRRCAASLARGEPAPPEWERELTDRLRRHARGPRRARAHVAGAQRAPSSCTTCSASRRSSGRRPTACSPRRGAALLFRAALRERRATSRGPRPTSPLVDEADALLGPAERGAAARRRRRSRRDGELEAARRTVDELGVGGYTNAAEVARPLRRATPPTVGDDDDEPRTFGHVLVDEAQDLTAMQWRMLARRCPSGSMTLVGDFGQASRPGAPRDWDDVLAQPAGHERRRDRVTLTVNYRTPAEIMDLANRLLAGRRAGRRAGPVRAQHRRAPRGVTVAGRRARRRRRRRPRARPRPRAARWP